MTHLAMGESAVGLGICALALAGAVVVVLVVEARGLLTSPAGFESTSTEVVGVVAGGLCCDPAQAETSETVTTNGARTMRTRTASHPMPLRIQRATPLF